MVPENISLNKIKNKEYLLLMNSSGEIQRVQGLRTWALELYCQGFNSVHTLPLTSLVTLIKSLYFFVYHFFFYKILTKYTLVGFQGTYILKSLNYDMIGDKYSNIV